MRPTASEKTLSADGWSIAYTNPLLQEFMFERFLGGRRVGTATVRGAKTTDAAWRALRELIDANLVLPTNKAARASA